jgi:hypothetical protein
MKISADLAWLATGMPIVTRSAVPGFTFRDARVVLDNMRDPLKHCSYQPMLVA